MHHTIHSKTIIYLSGPTAVGKTAATEIIAQKVPIEVINADVGQFYVPLSIGTAKPDVSLQKVPHHGFDIFSKPLDFSAFAYRNYVEELVCEIWSRGNIPLITGGSLFYIWALFFAPGGVVKPQQCAHLSEEKFDTLDLDREAAWSLLLEKDPIRAYELKATKDPYRLFRALSMLESGVMPSSRAPLYTPLKGDHKIVFLTRDRDELYARINQRVFDMMRQGWLQEVENLPLDWKQFLERKKLLGYVDIMKFMKEDLEKRDYDCLIETIQQKTRQYAKRQLTFWRKFSRALEKEWGASTKASICEANLTLSPLDLYIEQVIGNLER